MATEESEHVVVSTALVAPITALEFMGENYFLTAEGPVLSVYSLHPQPKLCGSLSVLQNYRIHGLRPRPLSDCGAEKHHVGAPSGVWDRGAELAVFGGKGLRLATLTAPSDTLQLGGPLMELPDWLLDVQWLGERPCSLLGVVLAHNTALLLDAKSGSIVRLRSCQEVCLLYSGLLIGSLWDSAVLVGGTVFNQLVLWRPGTGNRDQNWDRPASVERRLLGHSGVIFSLAYLPEAGLLASASDDRSVRVWSVGALGGSRGCGQPEAELETVCQRVLYGHQARVFCVRLARTGVFSAGEDGACVMWGEDGRVERRFKGHRAGGVRALAVSEKQQWVATGGADGGVRVWRAREQEEEEEETESLSREGGEAEGVVDLEFRGEGSPKAVCLVEHSTGVGVEVEVGVLVCTDRGRVYLRQGQDWRCVWVGDSDFQSYCVMEAVCVRGGRGCVCAVGNLNGRVCVFPLAHPDRSVILSAGAGKVHSLQWVWPRQGQDVCLLASGAEGRVYRWQVGVIDADAEGVGVALTVKKLCPFLLPPCAKRWLTAAVTVTRTPNANGTQENSTQHSQGVVWVCGDRRGSLLLYYEHETNREKSSGLDWTGPGKEKTDDSANEMTREAEEIQSAGKERGEDVGLGGRHDAGMDVIEPACVLFGLHGKQGVTSVYELDGVCYSTGRDGFVRTLVVHGNTELTVQRAQRAAKGMEWLERVLFLREGVEDGNDMEEMGSVEVCGEGGMERERENGGREGGGQQAAEVRGRVVLAEARFALVGFRSSSFVVWDPLRQETLLSVPCGGGHRSWGYRPPLLSERNARTHAAGAGLLVFIKQGAVLARYPPTTRAGRSVATATGQSLREGLHGRGVGCVCRLGALGRWEAVATGGEDTCVSVLAVHCETGAVRVLSVITDHISSVRALTALRRDGVHPSSSSSSSSDDEISCLLFSAGGRAQLQCYRLLIGWDGEGGQPTCQVSQIASHRLDEQWERKRNRHKTVKMDPETRYMSVCVVHDGPDRVLLALACSDGAVRLFGVSEQAAKVELLWECHYHQRCVLSIAARRLQSPSGRRCVLVLSAATDGRVCVWDWSSVLALDGGQSWEGPTAPCLTLPIHQSGVNSLAVWEEEPGPGSEKERLLSLATGGDDGQLSVLLLKATFSQCQPEGAPVSLELLSHWSEPLAHAAPLTALQVIDRSLIVSASPDQRVCVWSACQNSSSLRRLAMAFTHTADVAGLQVWHREGAGAGEGTGAGAGAWAAVCGQGLQLLRITPRGHDGGQRDGQKDTDSEKPQERLKVAFQTRNGT